MIQSFADILKAFMEEESRKLGTFNVRHGPTIGAMYEGLSADILNKSIPPSLDLHVVNGFVVDRLGNQSGQIDCMLVRGSGEKIPFTDSYRWPVDDALAVFEVKKTLSYTDLKDGFVHLRDIYDLYRSWFHEFYDKKRADVTRALNAFDQITGVHSNGRTDDIPRNLQLMHYTLIMEQLAPVRIIWAYGGYKTQTGLREAIARFLETSLKDKEVAPGLGVGCFPQLISCNGISIIKGNGQPYYVRMRGDLWPFLFSSVTNPLWLMMELIWTKIESSFRVSMPFEDGIEQEAMAELLAAQSMEKNDSRGWGYAINDHGGLDMNPRETVEFKPLEIDVTQAVVLISLRIRPRWIRQAVSLPSLPAKAGTN